MFSTILVLGCTKNPSPSDESESLTSFSSDRSDDIVNRANILSASNILLQQYYQLPKKDTIRFEWFFNSVTTPAVLQDSATQLAIAQEIRNVRHQSSESILYYLQQNNYISKDVFDQLSSAKMKLNNLAASCGTLSQLKVEIDLFADQAAFNLELPEKDRMSLLVAYSAMSFSLLQVINGIPSSASPVADRGICEPGEESSFTVFDAGWMSGLASLAVLGVVIAVLPAAVMTGAVIVGVIISTFIPIFVALCWGDEVLCWLTGSWLCDDSPDCTPAAGVTLYPYDCNQFAAQAYGYGQDINMVEMEPVFNSNPSSTVQGNAFWKVFSVPILSLPSRVRYTSVCSNGTSMAGPSTGSIIDLATSLPTSVPNIHFVNPPNTVPVFIAKRFFIDQQSSGTYSITWTVNGSGGVSVGPSGAWADLTFWSAGVFTVKATIKNNCSGANKTITRQITVTQ